MRTIAFGIALSLSVATAALAAPPQATHTARLIAPNLCIASGSQPKPSGGNLTIRYGMNFKAAPTVVVSPFNDGQTGVGHVETIISISVDQFVDTSDNSGGTYYVDWIAVGEPQSGACE
jgi:hypothetical protein